MVPTPTIEFAGAVLSRCYHLVGTKTAFSTFVHRDLASWLANCRTSIGMFKDAAEICPAMA